MFNEPTSENLSHSTTAISSMSQSQDGITQQMTSRQPIQDNQILANNSQEDINSQDVISNFFYKPPNDYQIYDISYKEIPISFELVSELLDGNNNSCSVQNHVQPNNLHEFFFLKVEEKKCYKVTCVLFSHSLIVEYLNKNIHGVEFNHNEQQQIYVEFTKELKENLEYYLRQFLASNNFT
jgi:hypothetical protein